MNFIKKIFEDRPDNMVHMHLQRLGKGEYERAFINIKKGKDLRIKTSFEFSNDLFSLIADNAGKAEVSGKIIANFDFEKDFDFSKFSKRGKLYTGELKLSLNKEQMKNIYEKFRLHYILLNVKADKFRLSVKSSLPKPGSPLKDDFCSFACPLEFLDEFAFDVKDFKELKITHKFIITDLIVPKEAENDFAKARELAKRKGKLIRTLDVDGKTEVREKEFVA